MQSGVGEAEGGVSFCEIEYDATDIMKSGLGMTYLITSMPTLLSFDRGEAMGNRVVDVRLLRDERWLREWIRNEAGRRGGGGGGGGLETVFFGGLFGNTLQ